jgi:hypothetical protein
MLSVEGDVEITMLGAESAWAPRRIHKAGHVTDSRPEHTEEFVGGLADLVGHFVLLVLSQASSRPRSG